MNKFLFFIYITFFVFAISLQALADYRGCCSGHGGTDCINGITVCKDNTEMSEKCKEKCDKCGTVANNFATSAKSNVITGAGNTWNDSFNRSKKTLQPYISLFKK
jgi:hypothetical protein